MTGAELKRIFLSQPERTAKILTRSLTEFGYRLDAAYVKAEIQRLIDGGEAKGGPSMFLSGWLEEGID